MHVLYIVVKNIVHYIIIKTKLLSLPQFMMNKMDLMIKNTMGSNW